MRKFLKLVVVYILGFALAGILTVGMILGCLFLKKQICHMDEEKWKRYFQTLSNVKIIGGIFCMCSISLGLIAFLCYDVCKVFGFQYPSFLVMSFFLIGIGKVLFSYYRKKDEFQKKFDMLRCLYK